MRESFSVTFSCTADSVPPPELELRFGNSALGLFDNGTITLKNINASNQGTYECVPRNILGTGPTATLNLTVLGKYGDEALPAMAELVVLIRASDMFGKKEIINLD